MKHSNILKLAIAALLPVLSGCSDIVLESLATPINGDDGDTVTVTFGLDFDNPKQSGTATRANGESSLTFAQQIDNYSELYDSDTQAYINPDEDTPIYILAFDENHLLTDMYRCQYKSSSDVDGCDFTHHYFQVTLNKTKDLRYFHIIANHAINGELPYATESDIFNSSLMVAHSNNVYWRRLELPNGVDDNVVNYLNGVKLIRNFARVTLDFSSLPTTTTITKDSKSYGSDYFTEVKWCMMNIPTESFVAPYLKGQEFATFLKVATDDGYTASTGGSDHDNSVDYTYDELYEEGYRCHVPRTQDNADTFYTRTTADEADGTEDESNVSADSRYENTVWREWYEAQYTYENEGSNDSYLFKRTTFLIRAKTINGETWYYRLNLVDPDRNYEQLYLMRNVSYNVKVTAITDVGFDSASEAFIRAASNNFSGAVTTSAYTNVSANGASLRVEYMTKYIFSNDDVTMKYRYVPDITNLKTDGTYVSENDNVTVTSTESYNTSTGSAPAFVGSDNTKYAVKSYKQATADIDNSNYRLITFTPNKPQTGDVSTTSKVRIEVADKSRPNNNSLYRDVTFVLRNRYKMKNMQISKDATNTYTLTVDIPNDLPKEIFPLDFIFETYPPVTYPNADKSVMHVIGGDESLFLSASKDTFHFNRAVTWEKYNSSTVFNTVNGCKQITFFFHILIENLPDDIDYLFFAVYEPSLSPDPDGQIDYKQASPLYGSFKFETTTDSSGADDVNLTKKDEYLTDAAASAAWKALKK